MYQRIDRIRELAKEQAKWAVVSIAGAAGVVTGLLGMTFGTNVSILVPIITVVSLVLVVAGQVYGHQAKNAIEMMRVPHSIGPKD